jgi:hypothetical protein
MSVLRYTRLGCLSSYDWNPVGVVARLCLITLVNTELSSLHVGCTSWNRGRLTRRYPSKLVNTELSSLQVAGGEQL